MDATGRPPLSAADYRAQCRSRSTRSAYRADLAHFESWCRQAGQAWLPADAQTVGAYLAAQAGEFKVSTLARRLSAIVVAHREAGFSLPRNHPEIAEVLAGIRRVHGSALKQKEPLGTPDLELALACLGSDLAGVRDAAVLTLSYAGAFRRGEIAALNVDDITFAGDGVSIKIRRGKEDQEGVGLEKGIPRGERNATCPVARLKCWIIAAKLDEGPLFRAVDRHGNLGNGRLSGRAIAAITQRAIAAAGARAGWSKTAIAARVTAIAGHSWRAGAISTMARNGVPVPAIMAHSGHRSLAGLRPYLRRASLLDGSPAGRLGL